MRSRVTVLAISIISAVCLTPLFAADYFDVDAANYNKVVDGKQVALYTIKNSKGMIVKITNYGAKIEQIIVPDKKGKLGDVALGYESIDKAMTGQGSFGAFVGRYANRIGGAKFTLDGKEYKLNINEPARGTTLHGGNKGSRFCVFDANQLDAANLEMFYTFKDGEENFPGTLAVRVKYTVTENNEFIVDYQSYAADKNTVANFTSHTFFNLSGDGNADILDHVISVNAKNFLEIDKNAVPTGVLKPVAGTPLDFTKPAVFGSKINMDFEQIKLVNGIDHHFALDKKLPNGFELAGTAWHPKSGRYMEVWTTEPGMQLHSGNNLEGKEGRDQGKGKTYKFRNGFNMEPSRFPDGPNKPNFPSTVVKAGQWYSGKIMYKFSVK
jgi:aldose 1-epimerase